MLEVGMKAPEFTLPDKNGNMVSLSDFLGKKVVLYFYPKDNTPGCTRQACAFALKNKEIEDYLKPRYGTEIKKYDGYYRLSNIKIKDEMMSSYSD